MGNTHRMWQRLRTRFVGGLALPLLFPLYPAAHAEELIPEFTLQAVPQRSSSAASNISSGTQAQPAALTLPECIQLALEKQPAIAAARASLAAAQAGQRGLDSIRVPTFLVRDLPIRRQQARIGVAIAAAGVEQAEHETVYAVTRLYYTVLYARAQKKVADDVVAHMEATRTTAQRLLDGGSREVTTSTVDKITVYQRLAQTKQADATQGVERALAGLREAIGLDPCYPLKVAAEPLPAPNLTLNRDEVVALALARRGELVQVTDFAEITCLEVKAQGTRRRPQMKTFASGAGIHARPVPQGISNSEYRPGAIGPEMPVSMAGSRDLRMERARDLYARAQAVVDKTRNLIALEAEDTYLKWKEASAKVAATREASEKGAKLAEDTRRDFGAEQKVKAEDVLTNEVLASQAQAQYNEARYQLILALAALQRITAVGVNAGLAGPAAQLGQPQVQAPH
jgi:outer membrane protein TolC